MALAKACFSIDKALLISLRVNQYWPLDWSPSDKAKILKHIPVILRYIT